MKRLMAFCIILLPIIAFAAAPTWQIIPANSSITFTGIQNGAPTTGKFKSFTGDVAFDPAQLSSCHVKIIVDVASVSNSYNQLTDTLKSEAWFNVKKFPQAVYNSNTFIKTGDKTYQSKGALTIRDKTVPVILDFTVEDYSPTKMLIKGSTTLKRTAFGVGQGEWADTKAVKDEVKVDFVLAAQKK